MEGTGSQRTQWPKLTEEEIESANRYIINKDIKLVMKWVPTKEKETHAQIKPLAIFSHI
jgi:hypothetical protein